MNSTPAPTPAPQNNDVERQERLTLNERFLTYLDHTFSPETHRRRYRTAALFLLSGILLVALAITLDGDWPVALSLLPLGIVLAGHALWTMHHMVRSAQFAQRRRRIVRRGEPVLAYIVQASESLFRPGVDTLPCQVVFSFQSEVGADASYMRYLAQRAFHLKNGGRQPDMDRQYIAAIVSDDRAVPNRRYLLPHSFTDGSTVYIGELTVHRAYLRGGCLTGGTLPCIAEPGPNGGIELVPVWLVEEGDYRVFGMEPALTNPLAADSADTSDPASDETA